MLKKYIKTLNELNRDSLPEAGGKGANLGGLIKAGLPVPPGFVVTAGAYRDNLESTGLKKRIAARLQDMKETDIPDVSREVISWIEEAPMPFSLQEEVSLALEQLAGRAGTDRELCVAVRSSATAEDLPSASFAGQHDTYLGIWGKEAVFHHIKKCWASLWSPQAISYRMTMGFDHLEVHLAVVVQAMISAEAAGVMFTANPVTGRRDEILISAGYGLGEAVVSGLINPDTFILNREGQLKETVLGSKERKIILTKEGTVTEEVSLPQRKSPCLGPAEFKQLVNLAYRVEECFGELQDTEWALSQGKIYLLQARPITTMEQELPDYEGQIIYQGKKVPSSLQSVMEHSLYPHKPLDFASFKYFYQGIYSAFHQWGFKLPESEIGPVEREDGCVAVRCSFPGISPAILWKLPKLLLGELFNNKNQLWLENVREMKRWLEQMDEEIKNTDDAEKLVELFERALKEYEYFVQKRFSCIGAPGGMDEVRLGSFIKKAAGKAEAKALKEQLMRDLPFRTALYNKALLSLARTAAEKGKDSQGFRKEFKAFLEEYGDRPSVGVGRMLSPSTLCEKPQLIDGMLAVLGSDSSAGAEENGRRQALDFERARQRVETGLKPEQYKKFLILLERVRSAVIVREESVFYLEKLAGRLHAAALKLGEVLAAKKVINEADNVFFLLPNELKEAAGEAPAMQERVEKRKQAFARIWAAHEQGIHWLIATGSFPKADKKRDHGTGTGSNSIKGTPTSQGVYEGPVCIVRSPGEFHKLKKGDVLVSPYTTPDWTPLFKIASAVVTEVGSASSHAAIVAREYGIPAVSAVDGATERLKDGQKIRVDGIQGVLRLIKA